MRSRLLALVGALALALGGLAAVLLMSGGPASAAAHCTGVLSHPDKYIDTGGVHFGNGTRIKTHPYDACTTVGLGYPTHRINVHCARVNANGVLWLYVKDVTTGKSGWARYDTLRYTFGVLAFIASHARC